MRPALALLLTSALLAQDPGSRRLGESAPEGQLLPSGQVVRPAGQVLAFPGRPVDLLRTRDGATLLLKAGDSLKVLDAATWTLRQSLDLPPKDTGSMHGLAEDGSGTVWLTTAWGGLLEVKPGTDGRWAWGKKIPLPFFEKKSGFPCGVAIQGRRAVVALSRANALVTVDLDRGVAGGPIPVGVAPYGVALSPDGRTAFVSNWGGRRPRAGERTMASSGTEVLVDEKNLPLSGTVMKVDLAGGGILGEVEVGLHPGQLLPSPDGSRLFVANANSDTVAVVDTATWTVLERISVRPAAGLPYGSLPTALALAPDGKTLYVANAGNNAVAVIHLGSPSRVAGFIPTGWFPAALAVDGGHLFVANAKGEGSREDQGDNRKWRVQWERGSAQKVPLPEAAQLATWTREVQALVQVPRIRAAFAPPGRRVKPVPVPKRPGEPSVFRHVVYVIKENRTYDQVFGDLPKGKGDPELCIYGREVTPNHHALAERFALLDNYYCSGIVSADGHQWATQGITSDYQEKAFGHWTRSYDFGTDPLAFAPTPFLWDQALLHGRSFRNYGEFDFPTRQPEKGTWLDWYRDHQKGTRTQGFTQRIDIAPLRPYTAPGYPGWDMQIPDVVRVERFLEEFRAFERQGSFPDLTVVYLPQDHTQGKTVGVPTPRAHMADNDLALGRLVEALSRSPFWKETVIFVNEDDPQDGWDHVDGHRSLCLVISPYTRPGAVVSRFYSQGSVLHTIGRILGLPPLNQMVAASPTMEACFGPRADLRPYTALPARVPLDELNAPNPLAEASAALDLRLPDRIDDDAFNRILWADAKGTKPYPAHLAGAHGKGLRKRGLKALGKNEDDD